MRTLRRSSPEALYVASLERVIGLTPAPTREPAAVRKAEAPAVEDVAASEAEAPEKEAAVSFGSGLRQGLLRVLLPGGPNFGSGLRRCGGLLPLCSKKSLEPPTFTASDMRRDWQAIWCPANAAPEAAAHWREAARAHALPQPRAEPQASVPTFDAFSSALASASGSAGFDGWEACELKALPKHLPPKHLPELCAELYQLWCDTTRSEASAFVQAASSWKTVGLPKRGSGSRPSAVAEIDLAKAFDSVDHSVAEAALLWHGLHPDVCRYLVSVWQASRVCVVSGLPSEPIFPHRRLPQGDPVAGAVLAYVLAPWSSAPRPSCTLWAFVDDRTLAITGPSGRQGLLDALQFTREFDNAVGLTENIDKRQIWIEGEHHRIEHLGLSLALFDANCPILPRNGWDPLVGMIQRLATIPGAAHVRERLAAGFIMPVCRWACPLVSLPPASAAPQLLRAILASQCTWWCAGRWWAQRIQLHPIYGTAIHGLSRVRPFVDHLSPHLANAVDAYASALGMLVHRFTREHGLALAFPAGTDIRLVSLLPDPACPFNPWTPLGKHVLRQAGRLLALGLVKLSRFDSEGVDSIDLEASSHFIWARWVRSLSSEDSALLNIWRSGAGRTPTRRHYRRNNDLCVCPFCDFQRASARHFFSDCPRFAPDRLALQDRFGIQPDWWSLQPRVTAKSGWVVLHAHPSPMQRARCQVAACALGIAIKANSPRDSP